MYDTVDLSNVKSVRYFNDEEQQIAEDSGYDGGYVYTYNDGSEKQFCWLPYSDTIEEVEEVVTVIKRYERK